MIALRKKLKRMESLTDSNILNLERLTQELNDAELKDKNGSVLLVDDEAIIAEDYADVLKNKGYYTESVRSGEDALDRLRARSFSVMVADLRLPGMSGIELIEKAHIIRPDMRIIVATAYPNDYFKSRKLRRKDDAIVEVVLSKSMNVDEQLVKRIENPRSEESYDK